MSRKIEDVVERRTPPPATGTVFTGWRIAMLVLAAFIALVGVRVITGEAALTSSGTVRALLQGAVPIGLCALGGLFAERAGIINIGLEGMMIVGTWTAAYTTVVTGSPWAGLLGGILGGMAGGLLHAVATVTFGVDHIVSGVAINILALSAMRYLAIQFFLDMDGGGAGQSPQLPNFPRVTVPGVEALLGPVEAGRWFLVSDIAALIIGLTTQVSVITILAVLLLPGTWLLLWHTAFGLRLRSVGENPDAAESLGVRVYTFKYIALLTSGGLAGLGGTYLAMVAASGYQEGQTGGRGYIGLAAMIFGNWRPSGIAMGAGLFGYTEALADRGAGEAVNALLLLVGVVLLVVAAWQVRQGKPVMAAVVAVIGAGALTWFFAADTVPSQLVTATPYIATMLILALFSQRLRPPQAVGRPWRREKSG
jgi:general nucleoside transport system permease protein